jgi:Bacterial TSP3 repeat
VGNRVLHRDDGGMTNTSSTSPISSLIRFGSVRPFRRVASLALFATAVGFVPATRSSAAPLQQKGPVIACQNSVCIVNPFGIDSDGDGFSDADEMMAGTDPYNAKSFPMIFQLVQIWGKGVETGKAVPFREVIVMPETTPDGKSIGSNPIGELPGRKDTMSQLGLTNPKIAEMDQSNGIHAVLNIGIHQSSGGKDTPPPARTNGMDISLISGLTSGSSSVPGGERETWYDENGKNMGYDETIHNADGTNTYTSCKSDGTCSSSTSGPHSGGYYDPDYSGETGTPAPFGQIIVATPAQVKAFNLKRGANTRFADTGTKPDASTPPTAKNGNPTIILVNPEDDSVWLSNDHTVGVPTNFNRFGGNVNGGRPDGPSQPGCGNPGMRC